MILPARNGELGSTRWNGILAGRRRESAEPRGSGGLVLEQEPAPLQLYNILIDRDITSDVFFGIYLNGLLGGR